MSNDVVMAILIGGALLAGFFLGGAEPARVRVRLRSMPARSTAVARR